jgi:1-acyl-sn-glycerol-3-phosphate acyltransferase
MKRFSKWVLKICGWKMDYNIPKGVDRCVLVSAPHTSNWDFVWGRLTMWSYGIHVKLIIKKEAFFFPLGWFLKRIGGIPVNRKGGPKNVTDQITKLFDENEKLCVMFTPEGTRSYNPNWKRGFYFIALKAQVPIYLGYMDYEKKIGGISHAFHPTGDVEKDIEEIKGFYKNYKGKYPEQGVL